MAGTLGGVKLESQEVVRGLPVRGRRFSIVEGRDETVERKKFQEVPLGEKMSKTILEWIDNVSEKF